MKEITILIQSNWFTYQLSQPMFVSTSKSLLFVGLMALSVIACEMPSDEKNKNVNPTITTEEPTPVTASAEESKANQYLIKGDGFYGLLSGVPLAERMDRLEKGNLSDGEGEFNVYYIKGVDGDKVGYVLPHTQDEQLIGSITISTPKATTEDGIRIGSTLADLQAINPDIQVYGSEVEGRTHAIRGREMFLLDVYKAQYELDESKIDPTTVIKQITLQQHRAN